MLDKLQPILPRMPQAGAARRPFNVATEGQAVEQPACCLQIIVVSHEIPETDFVAGREIESGTGRRKKSENERGRRRGKENGNGIKSGSGSGKENGRRTENALHAGKHRVRAVLLLGLVC